MDTLIDSLREIVGVPEFYIQNSNYNYTWDYGAMIEYISCIVLIIVCIVSVFKFITRLVK